MIKMLFDNVFTKASERMKYIENIVLLLIIANIINCFHHEKFNQLFNNIDKVYYSSIVTFLDIFMIGLFILVEISLILFCVYGILYSLSWDIGKKAKGLIAEKLLDKGLWFQKATYGCQFKFFSSYQYLIVAILLMNLLQPEILIHKKIVLQSYVKLNILNLRLLPLIIINYIGLIMGSLNFISRFHYKNFHFISSSEKSIYLKVEKLSDERYICVIEE